MSGSLVLYKINSICLNYEIYGIFHDEGIFDIVMIINVLHINASIRSICHNDN